MKKMCLVMLTVFIIIICVIAFQSLNKSDEEVFDGILIEKNLEEKILLQNIQWNGGIL